MMPERKSAVLLLINVALLCALGWAGYHGYFVFLWKTDFSKLSFVILAVYFVTAGFVTFNKHRESLVQEIADLLPGIALVGTVLGIILVLSALSHVAVSGAGDFKALIEPILIGAGTSFQPTLLGVAASVLLRCQVMMYSR